MKTIFQGWEVAALWAERKVREARTRNRSMFCDGETIYSYGKHFPIARHVMSQAKPCVLLTTRHYSNTTSRHISLVRTAVSRLGVLVFMVTHPDRAPESSFVEIQSDIKTAVERAKSAKPKTLPEAIDNIDSLVRSANEFSRFFHLNIREKRPSLRALRQKADTQRVIRALIGKR